MNYSKWCSQSDAELAAVDVALLNLTAAMGLPGAESIHIPPLIRRLDDWTSLVEANTKHWRRNFKPKDDCPTENHFRMMAMVTVLQRDLGVGYNPACMTGPSNAMDSRDNFLHGPLTGHGGTCSSLPILYLAVGRRLGYPLYLVSAVEHFFVRWDDGTERFNVECTSRGYNSRSDEDYHHWPKSLSPKELASGFFLQNHTPREELASFIANRGHCFMDHLKMAEALEAFKYATDLYKFYEGNWAVATLLREILVNLRDGSSPSNLALSDQIEITSPRPNGPWGRWALPRAQQELRRIIDLHRNKKSRIHVSL